MVRPWVLTVVFGTNTLVRCSYGIALPAPPSRTSRLGLLVRGRLRHRGLCKEPLAPISVDFLVAKSKGPAGADQQQGQTSRSPVSRLSKARSGWPARWPKSQGSRLGSWTGKPCFSRAFYFRPFNEKAPSALSTVRCLLIKYRIERNLAALHVFIFVGEK
jgi:hypothetical protein